MLSKFSVKRPYTVLVGVLLILILGFVSITKMTTDLLPSMNLPYAVVYTTYIRGQPGRGGDNGYKAGREFDGYH